MTVTKLEECVQACALLESPRGWCCQNYLIKSVKNLKNYVYY